MDQGLINLLLGLAIPVTSILTLILEKYFTRKKNNADYGSEVLELANKTAKSLKEAREELEEVNGQIERMEVDHEREIDELRADHKRKMDVLKARVHELERTITRYDISFTLQTHPHVQINDLKVVGKEDVTESQKMRAIGSEKNK